MADGLKLLLDMNLPPRWVATLEEAGFEAIHWSGSGDRAAADADIAAHAIRTESGWWRHFDKWRRNLSKAR